MAHVCCKTSSGACRTIVILDAAHGNSQQSAHNLVAVQTCHSQSHFFALHNIIRMMMLHPMTSLLLVTMPIEAHGLYMYMFCSHVQTCSLKYRGPTAK